MKYELFKAIGLRVEPTALGEMRLPEGGYGKDLKGKWKARPPGGDVCALTHHHVTEHADGTVTVTEPIKGGSRVETCGVGPWRLEKGVWTSLEAEKQLANQGGVS